MNPDTLHEHEKETLKVTGRHIELTAHLQDFGTPETTIFNELDKYRAGRVPPTQAKETVSKLAKKFGKGQIVATYDALRLWTHSAEKNKETHDTAVCNTREMAALRTYLESECPEIDLSDKAVTLRANAFEEKYSEFTRGYDDAALSANFKYTARRASMLTTYSDNENFLPPELGNLKQTLAWYPTDQEEFAIRMTRESLYGPKIADEIEATLGENRPGKPMNYAAFSEFVASKPNGPLVLLEIEGILLQLCALELDDSVIKKRILLGSSVKEGTRTVEQSEDPSDVDIIIIVDNETLEKMDLLFKKRRIDNRLTLDGIHYYSLKMNSATKLFAQSEITICSSDTIEALATKSEFFQSVKVQGIAF